MPHSVCVHAGHQKAIYEKTLHLEDLLELQHLRDPVSIIHSHACLHDRFPSLLHCHY